MAKWGHIKISRKAYATDLWWLKPRIYSEWEAWEDCIQLAAWEPTEYRAPWGDVVNLDRGQLLVSVRHLVKRWRWGDQRVQRWLRLAVAQGRIVKVRTIPKFGTVYVLVNYDTYQVLPRSGDDRRYNVTTEVTTEVTTDDHYTDRRSKAPPASDLATTLDLNHHTQSPHSSPHKSPQQEGSKADKGQIDGPSGPSVKGGWPAQFAEMYQAIGLVSPGLIGKQLKPVVEKYGLPMAREMWEDYINAGPFMARDGTATNPTPNTAFMSPAAFVRTAATWHQRSLPIPQPEIFRAPPKP